MNKLEIIKHIAYRKSEKEHLYLTLKLLDSLHHQSPFSEKTYNEIRAKFSSAIAQCDISIRDHEKLLE